MSPVIFAIVLILAGLAMCWMHEKAKGILSTIVLWTGIVLIIVGLILLLFPLLAWVHAQIKAAMGA